METAVESQLASCNYNCNWPWGCVCLSNCPERGTWGRRCLTYTDSRFPVPDMIGDWIGIIERGGVYNDGPGSAPAGVYVPSAVRGPEVRLFLILIIDNTHGGGSGGWMSKHAKRFIRCLYSIYSQQGTSQTSKNSVRGNHHISEVLAEPTGYRASKQVLFG